MHQLKKAEATFPKTKREIMHLLYVHGNYNVEELVQENFSPFTKI